MLLQAEAALQDTLTKMAKAAAEKQPLLPDATDPQKMVSDLKSIDWNALLQSLTDEAVDLVLRIVAAVLVFYVGKFIIMRMVALLRRAMTARQADLSLSSFLLSLTRITLMFVLVITCIGILGIETSSFIAIFASAGVAIGMALSGTLQNFAGGVLILLLKPYKVGDYITFGSYSGFVREIQIFHTIITTYGNQRIVIPNGGLSTGTINNVTAEPYLRVEWKISLAYGDDIDQARKAILGIINADPRVVVDEVPDEPEVPTQPAATQQQDEKKRPWWRRIFHHAARIKNQVAAQEHLIDTHVKPQKPTVSVDALADSSVNLVVRAWTRSADYWAVYYGLLEVIYRELPKRGLHFPYPQVDVNLKQ